MQEYLVKILMEVLKQMNVEKVIKDLLQSAKEQFLCWLQLQAVKTGTPLDDVMVELLAKILEVDAGKCKVPVSA